MKALFDADGSRASLTLQWYELGLYSNQTLPDAMAKGVQLNASKRLIFYSDSGTVAYTVEELYERSVQLAGAFYRLGLRPGDVVGIQVPNWVEGCLALQAAMIAGVVVLPIVHIYGAAEVSYLLRESGAKALFLPDTWRNINYLERIVGLEDVSELEHIVVIGKAVPDGCVSWRDFNDLRTLDFPRPELDPDEVAMILFTSGTTANPKGVLHSHNSILAELRAGGRKGGVVLSPWPAGHIASILGLLQLYFAGSESVLMDVWDPAAAALLIERFGVTRSSGTPFHVNSLLDAAARDARNISSLNEYMVGAAAVSPKIVERCDRLGITTYRAYGSSEHPTITSGSIDDSPEQRARTDGTLNTGCQIQIVDDEGNPLPVGEPGEILSQGPDQFLGYHREDYNEAAFYPGGWFRTGDIGCLDENGFLTITDRKKDIIIRGGENIASKEVEGYLVEHYNIVEAAVVAAPDERLGEKVCAFLLLAEGGEISKEDIKAHFLSLQVAKQKIPERIEIVEELPRTPTGKVKKFELRDRLWEER